MGINNTIPHAQIHQEIAGIDPLVNYGLFERIKRVQKTTVNATPVMFSGVSSNLDNTLQSGHGWTATGNAAGSLNYTTDFILGTQCIKLTTDGGGVNSTKTTSPRETAVNLTAKMIRVWLKFDAASYANFLNAFLVVGSGASAFLNNAQSQFSGNGATMVANAEYAKPGEWVSFTFNPASFTILSGTMDWTAVQDYRISIKDNAAGPATLLFGGIDFIPNDSASPVVSLTFDDSYVGQFTKARPKMEQYGYKGTFYLIQDVIGTNNSTYMTQAQVDQLQLLGHELAPHAEYANDHNIAGGFTGISTQELMLNFGLQKGWMHQNGYKGIEHMALPQGLFNTALLAILKQQYAAVRTTTFRSVETLPVANAHRLRAVSIAANSGFVVTPNGTAGTLEWYLDQITLYGGWLIIFSHDFVTSGATGTQTNQTDWNTLIDYIATKGIPVRTVGDVLGI